MPAADQAVLILKLHRTLVVSHDPLNTNFLNTRKNFHQTGLHRIQIIRVITVPEVACMKLGMDFIPVLIMIIMFVMVMIFLRFAFIMAISMFMMLSFMMFTFS